MTHSESIAKITAALVAAQTEIKNMKPEKEGYGYNYVDLPSIIDQVKPVLKKHKLAVTQFPCGSNGAVGVSTILVHESGEFISNDFVMPLPKLAKMNDAQAAGAVITYARRYALSAVLNLTADEDIDAATPKASQTYEKAPESDSGELDDIKQVLVSKLKSGGDEGLFPQDVMIAKLQQIDEISSVESAKKTLKNLNSAIEQRRDEMLAVI